MPDISDNTIIFDAHECREGHCPICNGDDEIEYHTYEVVDSAIFYPWTCNTCGTEGKEIGDIHFLGHDIYQEGVPEQIESLFRDGGLRPQNERSVVTIRDTQFPITLEPGRFYILQLKEGEVNALRREVPYDFYERNGTGCNINDYNLVYSGPLGSVRENGEYAEKIHGDFCVHPPEDFPGRPVSQSDIIVITPGDEAHAFYDEESGYFTQIDHFLEQVADNVRFSDHDEAPRTFQKEEDRIRARPLEDAPLAIKINKHGVKDGDVQQGFSTSFEWIGLPTTKEILAETFERLEISSSRLNSWVACGLDSSPDCVSWQTMSDMVPKVDARSIDEANYLAAMVEQMVVADIPKLEALVEVGIHIENTADAINLIHNLGIYEFLPDVTSPHRYAQYLGRQDKETQLRTMLQLDNPDSTTARVIAAGQFTSRGFVRYPIKRFERVYDGKNVPEQYRVGPQREKEVQKMKPPKKRCGEER